MFEQFERGVREIREQRILEKHDESVDGEHRVPERNDSHTAITFPSPREEAEYTQACSEDEDTQTDVLFEELSEWHTFYLYTQPVRRAR